LAWLGREASLSWLFHLPLCGERIKDYENWTQARRDVAHLLFQDWHSPGSRPAVSPKLFAFREAGTQVFPVTMSRPSPRASAPPCLPLYIKDPLKEEEGLFALRIFALEGFLDFGLVLLLWGFWCGKLLEGKTIIDGKSMAKEWLVESLHQEL
jgi:hypothetical protein